MSLLMTAYLVALFVVLTPGVLLRIPAGGSKLTVAVVHGLVFALVLHLTYMFFLSNMVEVVVVSEGFKKGKKSKK